MPSTINASTTSTAGLVYNADASGILQLQSNGTTGLTVGTGGLVTAANGIVMNTMTLGSTITGEFEYDGGELYFTPLGTQRGLIPSAQYFRLNSPLAGTQATTAQNLLGVGVTLSSNTVYAFEAYFPMSKSAGTTTHSITSLFGGTATINNIGYALISAGSSAPGTVLTTDLPLSIRYVQTASQLSAGPGLSGTAAAIHFQYSGTVSINVGGTFIPQYQLSAAPGGVWTVAAGAYFMIYPVGAAGSNTSVGTWA
jgi:hypothetical protein